MRSFFGFLPALLWALVILVLSALSGLQPPPIRLGVIGPDKLAHFGVYALLALLLIIGFRVHGDRRWERTTVLLGGGAYGFAMELMQFAFFPDRQFEFWDILANIIGITAGWMAGFFIRK